MKVFDIEADELYDKVTKIHCLVWTDDGINFHETTDPKVIKGFLEEDTTKIGHNIVGYDIPTMEKILEGSHRGKLIDTLGLSWFCQPLRPKHGLETYGTDYGVPKPKVVDWKDQPIEVYLHRCKEDVKINWLLWKDQEKFLKTLYGKEVEDYERFLRYITFKMDCLREQAMNKCLIDKPEAKKLLGILRGKEKPLLDKLSEVMPQRKIMKNANKPKVLHKKDGSMSAAGERWFNHLETLGLPKDTEGPVKVFDRFEDPNPGSSDQVKDWLFSLGWKPTVFKKSKATGKNVEQVRKDGELSPCVEKLIVKEPNIEYLKGLTVIQHRIGVVEGFINSCNEFNQVEAGAQGLTNTLRFKHRKPMVNLPGVDKPWGKEIRSLIIAPEGKVLCGTDIVSLEDNTKRHYMKPIDPDYVEEMSQEGFDPHLDLAKHAGIISQEDIDNYNKGERDDLKPVRKNYKVTNYSATYGIQAQKLSEDLGVSRSVAQDLLDSFWKRNYAIKVIEKQALTKTVPHLDKNQMFLWNPLSRFWYFLRFTKDRFSTLNQGTGVYVFDTFMVFCRKECNEFIFQAHDENLSILDEGREKEREDLMYRAIEKVNNYLKLNVTIKVDPNFGKTYAEVH